MKRLFVVSMFMMLSAIAVYSSETGHEYKYYKSGVYVSLDFHQGLRLTRGPEASARKDCRKSRIHGYSGVVLESQDKLHILVSTTKKPTQRVGFSVGIYGWIGKSRTISSLDTGENLLKTLPSLSMISSNMDLGPTHMPASPYIA